MDIVLRQNGGEVGRFGLTTNKSDTQTNDVIKIVKDGTTYYGRLTSNIPNTTRKLKVTKNGNTLYLQTDPVGLQWAGTLNFTPSASTFNTVIASNIQYPKGVYRITIILRKGSDNTKLSYVQDFTVENGGIGDFRVSGAIAGFTRVYEVWCGAFGYFSIQATAIMVCVTVAKIG